MATIRAISKTDFDRIFDGLNSRNEGNIYVYKIFYGRCCYSFNVHILQALFFYVMNYVSLLVAWVLLTFRTCSNNAVVSRLFSSSEITSLRAIEHRRFRYLTTVIYTVYNTNLIKNSVKMIINSKVTASFS